MAALRSAGLLLWLLLCLCWLPAALAQSLLQAELDRQQLQLGEVATLTIRSDRADQTPDYAPLERDFLIYAPNLRRYSELRDGRFITRVEYVLGIQPRRAGTLQVPALRVGSQQTAPLWLEVRDNPGHGQAGQPAGTAPPLSFIRTRVDGPQPWAHQSVGVVVALYYATQLAGGELIQPAPAHAGLQQVGQDRVDQALVEGVHYNVVERRYLLLTERSGPLQLPPARFRGRAVGAGRGQLLAAEQDPPLQLQVQARPADVPEPWLPVHDLQLEWQQVPTTVEAGRGVELVLEARLDGASRAQLDNLPLPAAGPGYRLYPQATEVEESFPAERPQLLLRRRMVLVAEQPGTLQLPAVELAWWQVPDGQRRRSVQPAIQLQVVAASAAAAAPASDKASMPPSAAVDFPASAVPAPAVARQTWWWLLAAAALLSGLLLLWWWYRRQRLPVADPAAAVAVPSLAALQAQLEHGGLQEIIDTLAAMAGVAGRQALLAALAQPQQRQALLEAEQAWWAAAGGDRVGARANLRRHFRQGPVWQARPAPLAAHDPLPALYPGQRPPSA